MRKLRGMVRGLALAVLVALAARGAVAQGSKAGTSAVAAPWKPALTVVLSLDGLSYRRLETYRPYYVAGLKRLLDEGQVETGARYRHLNTETGPGHAALATGAPPRVTGIVANRWIEQNADGSLRAVSCAQQWASDTVPGQPPLFYREIAKEGRLYVFAQARELERWQTSGEAGRATVRPGYGPQGETVAFDSDDAIVLFNLRHGLAAEAFAPTTTVTGPGNLRVPTLGDRLVEASPGSRVVALSGKDRTSVFLAGHSPKHLAYWYDQETGRFVSSPVYDATAAAGAAAKALVTRFNRERAGAQLPARFGMLWKKLPPPPAVPGFGAAVLPEPAARLLDFQLPTNGLGFDHDLRLAEAGYFTGIYTSPFLDELVADLATDAIADDGLRLGRREAPDLLLLGFSAQDVVSHSYGNESEENLDTIRRLDLQLGRVLDALARALPAGSYVVALSADHGFGLIPEAEKARNPAATGGRLVNSARVFPNVYERLGRFLAEELCLPPGSKPIYGGEGWNLSYNRPAFPLRTVAGRCGPADRLVTTADLDAALPTAAVRIFGEELEGVLLTSQRERWPQDLAATEFARNDFDVERSGDAFLVPRPGVLMHWDPARGSHHGTHHEYDTHVPLVFWGRPFPAGRRERDCAPYDLAPTLAQLLGLKLPEATGRSLLDAR